MVQPGWKVSDPSVAEEATPGKNQKFRSNWGERESGFIGDEDLESPKVKTSGTDGAEEKKSESTNKNERETNCEDDGNGGKDDSLDLEESKTYEEFKQKVTD